jgi:cytochrome c553
VVLALSTGQKLGLLVFAAIFIAFALASSFLFPRYQPDFPGRGLRLFIAVTVVLTIAMLGAVEIFAKEEHAEEPAAAETTTPEETTTGGTTTEPAGTTTAQPATTEAQGSAEAGQAVFNEQGCGSCHAVSAAGSSGEIGPNLDESLEGRDADYVEKSIVDPNGEIAEGFQPGIMPQDYGDKLSDKQLADLVAFLLQ